MSRKYKFHDQNKLYFVSFAVVDWIDVFVRNEYRDVLMDSLSYCRSNKGLEVYAFCIMTSHVHLIIGTVGENMEDILRDMKSYTATRMRKAISENPVESRKEWMLERMMQAGKLNSNNSGFQFWRQDNHPIELSIPTIAKQKLDYLHNNPVAAGFVSSPEEYLYSSAANYSGKSGIFEVEIIDLYS